MVWLDLLLVPVLAAHLLLANAAAGGPLVALWLVGHGRGRPDALANRVGPWLLGASLGALVAAIVLGLATLGLFFAAHGESFLSSAGRVPASRYWFGVAELGFYFACVGAAWALWRPGRQGRRRTGLIAVLLFVGAADLIYHFPPLFTVIGVWTARTGPELPFAQAMLDPEVLSLVLHFVLSSLAVTGALLLKHAQRWDREPAEARRVAIWGGWWAVAPTAIQLPVGFWVLQQVPRQARDALVLGDFLGSTLFGLGMLGSIVLLHRFAAAAMGESTPRHRRWTVGLLSVVVLLMVATLHRTRQIAYDPPLPLAGEFLGR